MNGVVLNFMKTNNHLISVVVPLYNVEDYMKKCIDSIISQTYSNIEIILVNDGSPDKSGEIAEDYKKNNADIKVIHQKNGGLSSARNAGMEQSNGEFILFVDSDDWLEPNLIEKTYKTAIQYNDEICVFNVRRVFENTGESFIQGEIEKQHINVNEIGPSNYIQNYLLNPDAHRYSAWNRLYKRDFLITNNLHFEPNNEIHSEDLLFNLQCSVHVKRISYIDEPLYNHMLREGTISSSVKPNLTSKLMNLVEHFDFYIKKIGKFEEFKTIIPPLTQYVFFMSMASEIKLNKLNILELKSIIKTCYKHAFFKKSMENMGKEKMNKRNFISKILGYKCINIASLVLYFTLNSKNRR